MLVRTLASVLGGLLISACADTNDLSASAPSWECDKNLCTVTFSITSVFPTSTIATYTVRGVKDTGDSYAGRSVMPVGMIEEEVRIESGETLRISASLSVIQKPTRISVNVRRAHAN